MTKVAYVSDVKNPVIALRPDGVNIVILVVVWASMALLANPIGNFPINDDWVYGQAVQSLLEDGYYHFPSTSSANVGPQVFWGALFCWPFGFSYTALRISSLVAGLIGVMTLYFLLRRFCQQPTVSLVGALLLAVNPLYFSLSNSFMTDVPFVTTQLLSLFFLTRGLQRASSGDILIGITFSFAAVLIRQVGVILLIGLAAAYPVRFGATLRNLGKGVLPAIFGVLLHVGYQYWLVHAERIPTLSGHSNVNELLSFSGRGWYMRQMAFSIVIYWGLFLLPFLILIANSVVRLLADRRLGRSDLSLLTIVLGLTALTWWKGLLPPMLPNIINAWGIGPLTLHDTYKLELNLPAVPMGVSIGWGLVGILSLASGGALLFCIGWIGRKAAGNLWRPNLETSFWPTWLLTISAGSYLAMLIFMSGSLPMMDRYLLPFVPLLIVLVTHVVPSDAPYCRLSVAPSALLLLIYGYFSVTATHDYLQWNRLRWVAANSLMKDGTVEARQIDGGYEFNGLLAYEANYKAQPGKSWWWVHDDKYIIASGPIPGYSEMARYDFQRWFLMRPSSIVVLQKIGGAQMPALPMTTEVLD